MFQLFFVCIPQFSYAIREAKLNATITDRLLKIHFHNGFSVYRARTHTQRTTMWWRRLQSFTHFFYFSFFSVFVALLCCWRMCSKKHLATHTPTHNKKSAHTQSVRQVAENVYTFFVWFKRFSCVNILTNVHCWHYHHSMCTEETQKQKQMWTHLDVHTFCTFLVQLCNQSIQATWKVLAIRTASNCRISWSNMRRFPSSFSFLILSFFFLFLLIFIFCWNMNSLKVGITRKHLNTHRYSYSGYEWKNVASKNERIHE